MTKQYTDTDSVFLSNLKNRSEEFIRNPNLDDLLSELSSYLSPIDERLCSRFEQPQYPPLLLVGNPRSGTTLILQFLAMTEVFAVPTNLLSRFFYAPYIGSKIQLLLTDGRFDYRKELGDLCSKIGFSSSLGKTFGALAPSEFNHFWRQFLPVYDLQYLDSKQAQSIDKKGLASAVAAVESVFEKPFASKAIILQYNIDLLIQIFDRVIFLYIHREPIFIMQSILEARESFYGSRDIWWSVKPREYEWLKDMDVYHQIAGQVYFTEKVLEESLKSISEKQQLVVTYEDFCDHPHEIYTKLVDRYKNFGYVITQKYCGPDTFPCHNQIRLKKYDYTKLKNAYAEFSSGKKFAT